MNTTFAIVFGLVSMLGYGFANAFSQKLSRKMGPAGMLFLRGLVVVAVLGVMAALDAAQFQHWPVVLGAIGLGLVGYLPVLSFTHGIKESRLGVVAPIAGTSPLVTVLLAYMLLQAPVTFMQWMAIVLVVAANIAISVDLRNWYQSQLLRRSSGIPYAIGAALGWGGFYFVMVPVTRVLGPWVSAFAAEVGVTLAAGLHVWFKSRREKQQLQWKRGVVFNALLICLGTAAFTVGVRYFTVGIVVVLSNSTALVSAVLGAVLFGERLHLKEKLAAVAMVLGVVIISLFRA